MITLSVLIIVSGIAVMQFSLDNSEGDSETTDDITDSISWTNANSSQTYTLTSKWYTPEQYTFELNNIKPTNLWNSVAKTTSNTLSLVYNENTYELGSYTAGSDGSINPVEKTVSISDDSSGPVFKVSWFLHDATDGNSFAMRATIQVTNGVVISGDNLTVKLQIKGPGFVASMTMTKNISIVIPIAGGPVYDLDSGNMGTAVQFFEADSVDQVKLRTEYGSQIKNSESGKLILTAVYPSDDGKISSITFTDASGNEVQSTKKTAYTTQTNDSGTLDTVESTQHVYFFTMPSSKVTVNVVFNSYALKLNSDNGTVRSQLYGTAEGVFGQDGAYSSVGAAEAIRINSTYFEGDMIQLTATPASGYEHAGWTVVSGDVTVSSDNRFTMGNQPVELTAIFNAIEYNVTCNGCSGGSITAQETAATGSVVAVTVEPDAGYVLDTLVLSYGSTTEDISSTKSFTMPASDVAITATFKADESTSSITCTPSTSGANTILDLTIRCGTDASSLTDARILVVAKYGVNVVNVYSKPVLENGAGTDRVVVSTLDLTEVVLQLVDGIQPGDDGKVSSICFCSYVPSTTA